MNMNLLKHGLIELPRAKDARGTLSFYDGISPFVVKRVFWITNVPDMQERGYHAHRFCSELVVAVSGSFSVELTDRDGQVTYSLDTPECGLFIPPMCWCRLYDFSENAVLLCLADSTYSPEGYVNDFEEFRKEVGI